MLDQIKTERGWKVMASLEKVYIHIKSGSSGYFRRSRDHTELSIIGRSGSITLFTLVGTSQEKPDDREIHSETQGYIIDNQATLKERVLSITRALEQFDNIAQIHEIHQIALMLDV